MADLRSKEEEGFTVNPALLFKYTVQQGATGRLKAGKWDWMLDALYSYLLYCISLKRISEVQKIFLMWPIKLTKDNDTSKN